MSEGEIRVGTNGIRYGISERQFWIETDETGTVVMYFRGDKTREEQYAFVSQLIATMCVLRKAVEP